MGDVFDFPIGYVWPGERKPDDPQPIEKLESRLAAEERARLEQAHTTRDAIIAHDVPMEIEPTGEAVASALEMVTPFAASALVLPTAIWRMVENEHNAIRDAKVRKQRRDAWRAWRTKVAALAPQLRNGELTW